MCFKHTFQLARLARAAPAEVGPLRGVCGEIFGVGRTSRQPVKREDAEPAVHTSACKGMPRYLEQRVGVDREFRRQTAASENGPDQLVDVLGSILLYPPKPPLCPLRARLPKGAFWGSYTCLTPPCGVPRRPLPRLG